MSTDVDALLRATAAAADRPPTDDGWARLAHRLDGGPATPRRPARPLLLAAAAAVAAVVALTVVVAGSGGDGRVRAVDRPTTERPATTGAPAVPAPPDRPRVAVVGGGGAHDAVTLGPDGTAGGLLLDGVAGAPEVAGGITVETVDVGPDGTVYVGTCCEPVPGAVYAVGPDEDAVDLAGGPLLEGAHPAVSPDGSRLAVVDLVRGSLRVLDLGSGDRTDIGLVPPSPDGRSTTYGRLSWSPDGRSLAAEVVEISPDDTSRSWVTVVDVASGEQQQVVVAGEEGDVGLPAWGAAGLVVGVDATVDPFTLVSGATRLVRVEPATGAVLERYDLGPVRAVDASPGGVAVVAVTADERAVVVEAPGRRTGDELLRLRGLRSVAW